MANIFSIQFVDILKLEKDERQRNQNEFENLLARLKKNADLNEADHAELVRVGLLAAVKPKYFDPLFFWTRAELMSETSGLLPVEIDHGNDGTLDVSRPGNQARGGDPALRNSDTARAALLLGLLQLNNAKPPPIKVVDKKDSKRALDDVFFDFLAKSGRLDDAQLHMGAVAAGNAAARKLDDLEVRGDATHPNVPLFKQALFEAIGKTAGHLDLAVKVLDLLAEAVDINGKRGVSTLEYAQVFTKLVGDNIPIDDRNLKRRVDEALDSAQRIGQETPLHEFEIDLPDLEATAKFDIVPDHCKLFGSFIFASALEELRAFQVVDTLIAMSQRGSIPLIKGKAGTQLYDYWRQAPNRMREDERQTFYAMTLGLPTGQPGVAVNTDFQDLWLRFVSSVSTLIRETRMDALLRSAVPVAVNQQHVKKAARDLGMNMSAHGYGMVFYAAADLQKQINEMIALLGDKELCAAFGARDMWQVIDQIAQTELGGARNSSKYRMLATSGAVITSWLAKNVDRMQDPTAAMIELNAVQNPARRLPGQTAVSAPTDYDLVNACEMWLADSALGEDRVEQMSQPRESPAQPSRPIQIPTVARELLEGTGLGLGVGMGMGANGSNGNRRGRYLSY
jgi:hypothetical protein